MRSQFQAFLDGEERSVKLGKPMNIEEEYRKNEFPQICSAECPHKTCGYHNQEHYGKPCEMQWAPKETKDKLLTHTIPKTSYSESITLMVENAVKKAFKPLEDRLKAIENTPDYHVTRSLTPTLNGERIRVDRGMNQERIVHE